ncbi:MAG: type I-G CRISPR-associated RAMP protein Csb1/Cas7g [Ramlibacter sp.]
MTDANDALWRQWKIKLDEWLKPEGPIAIASVQYLEPALGKDAVIFPPTYPMPVLRGRVHTVKDGEYRVSVELPLFRDTAEKSDNREKENAQKQPGYNIDYFRDGSNICEIDSPQSHANRIEPSFKTLHDGKLVPQIVIDVKGDRVNLLDAGHRAADALVCFSSLCAEFFEAFKQAAKGNCWDLARLAPTSLLFGAWDSRSTKAKLPRLFKAQIRATDVELLTRSAQYVPATDYIQSGAIDEELNKGGEDKNPLSAEGFNAVPAPRMHGGVMVRGEIKREAIVNLAALREISAEREETNTETGEIVERDRSAELQRYLLALALVCLAHRAPLNLREGCLLRIPDPKKNKLALVPFEGEDQPTELMSHNDAVVIALAAAKEFFGDGFENKDRRDAVFEQGVADEYLRMSKEDREKLRRAGALTLDAIKAYKKKKESDPFKEVKNILTELKKNLPKGQRSRNATPEVLPNFFDQAIPVLERVSADEQLDEQIKNAAQELIELMRKDSDTKATWGDVDKRIKAFGKQQSTAAASSTDAPSAAGPQA